MSLINVVRDVCAVVGVAAPTAVFAAISTNRTMFEMLACANEMAQRIAYDTRDWQVLHRLWQFDGGVSEFGGDAFPLPADFKRTLLSSQVWRSNNTQRPLQFISDIDEWYQRRFANDSNAWGEWTISGGQLLTHPGFEGTQRMVYLDKNCITLASGGVGDRFLSDDDSFRLDERLLKLGMTYDWKMKKGSPYAEDMGTYSDAIANAMGRDKPSPILISGRAMTDLWGGHAQY